MYVHCNSKNCEAKNKCFICLESMCDTKTGAHGDAKHHYASRLDLAVQVHSEKLVNTLIPTTSVDVMETLYYN